MTAWPGGSAILGIEKIQAVQYFDSPGARRLGAPNSLPLVAGRQTVLRVYLSDDPAHWPGGVPDQVKVEISYPTALGPGVDETTSGFASVTPARREDLSKSLNLVVPAPVCRGHLDVGLRLFGARADVPGQWTLVVERPLDLEFVACDPVPVVLLPIDLTVEGGPFPGFHKAPAEPEMVDLIRRAAEFFPTPAIHAVAIVKKPLSGKTEFKGDLGPLLRAVAGHSIGATHDAYVVGVLPAGWAASKPAYRGRGGTCGALVVSAGDVVVAGHELGHVLGRLHSPHGSQSNPDPRFPWQYGEPKGNIGEWGLTTDAGILKLLSPADIYDYMGVIEHVWTSPYGWEQTLRAIVARRWATARADRDQYVNQKTYAFSVKVEAGRATDLEGYVIDGRPFTVEDGSAAYSVDLLDESGVVLSSHALVGSEAYPPADSTGAEYFANAIAWDDRTAKVVIREGHVRLGEFMAGNPAPVPSNLGLELSDDGAMAALSWSADAGDHVRFMVRYSHDGGTTWFPLAVDLLETNGQFDLSGLPAGGACVIEVAASTGISTATAQTETFSRSPQPLRPSILHPRRGTTFTADDVIEFIGDAWSPDRPYADEEEFRWSLLSPSSEPLGVGRRLVVPASALPVGHCQIGLEIAGGDADPSGADVHIRREA